MVVLEAGCWLWTGADGEEEGQDNDTNLVFGQLLRLCSQRQTYDRDDFDRAEPELELTEELDTEVVDAADDEQEDGNPDTWIDLICSFPFLNNERSSCQLIWRGDDVFAYRVM